MACAIGWETFFFIFRGGGGGEVLPRRCRIMIPRPHVSNVEEQKKLSGKSCGHLVSFVLAFPRSGRLPFHAPSRPCQVLGRLGPLMDLFIHLIVVANNLSNPPPPRAALVSHGLSLGYSMPTVVVIRSRWIRCREKKPHLPRATAAIFN